MEELHTCPATDVLSATHQGRRGLSAGFRSDVPQPPSTVEKLQARLSEMRERLPDIERITNNGAARAAANAERQADKYEKEATRLTAAAAKLQEEKTLRTRMAAMAPTQHAREAQERAAHIKQARQQAAEQARENARRAQREYRYESASQGRSGPSLGR